MGVLDYEKLYEDVKILVQQMDKWQWEGRNIKDEDIIFEKVLTREDLRNLKMEPLFYETRTSGSTGIPITIQKTYEDLVWYYAANIREFIWRKWNVTKNVAVIKTTASEGELNGWGIPRNMAPIQGKLYSNNYKPISELQEWLENVNPHYINCFPSIFKLLDTSKISNFIDWKGTGEVGGTCYSTEECGVIALQCPDNPKNMHVMENIYLDVDTDGGVLVTSFTNPYIKNYKHGDHVVLGEKCSCGRKLQTITKIQGRVRNMFTLPNGDKKWPLLGSLQFEDFGIKQFKATQTELNELTLEIVSPKLGNKKNKVVSLVQEMLGTPINVTINYVDSFPNYKFEEFISLL
jgi:phenylacetate-CoA ligase